ncbi:hypothetical protein AV530_013260 [Patagioenas fasciata monilis]|uniref:Uncharacterized protein n=1 Tax=Patagioenas fasciata monilis TaxID=372326 RepID=A0A1V4JNP5_PATFA|nr:hypothetical protein AV530_013260 [Patagioenas fasciata monilis]
MKECMKGPALDHVFWELTASDTLCLSFIGIPTATSDVGRGGGQEPFPVLINSIKPFISDLYQIILKNSSGEALYNIQMQVAARS